MATTDRDIRTITTAEVQAILNLDFELAFQLYEQKMQEHRGAEDAEAHYRAEADRLARENDDSYNEELEQISTDCELTSQRYGRIWQGLSQSRAARQRQEATAIEEKWRAARDIEMRRKAEAVEAQLGTARILAMCQKFEQAIEARDAAQRLRDDNQTPELVRIDVEFADRFRALIRRHEIEYQNLFTHLRSVIEVLKRKADTRKLTAQALLKKRNAFNAPKIIESVSQSPLSPAAREKVLQTYSPRSKSIFASPRSRLSAQSSRQGSPS
jgi:hypothetical protein